VYAATAITFNKQQRYRKQINTNKIQHVITNKQTNKKRKKETYLKEYSPVKK
jgi:hypothetical protein